MEKRYENYLDLIRDAKSFNDLLFAERKQRLPFIDSQTGIAQNDCHLWRMPSERRLVHNSGASALLYSYPAQRWQKRRREYLIKSNPFATSAQPDQSRLSNNSTPSTSSVSLPTDHHRQTTGPSAAPICANNFARSTHSQLVHVSPRADSTGSHSCHDSDSRDQSSATSQSIGDDEERYVEVDEEEAETAAAAETDHLLDMDLLGPHLELDEGQKLRDQTREAIRLHSKTSKKNAGQSLMKSKSILVKNKTSADDRTQSCSLADGRPPAMILNGSRPYVCSICDQTYKTRPGLSYHFIHTHNTTLPRVLPTMKDGQIYTPQKVSMRKEQSILVKEIHQRVLRNNRKLQKMGKVEAVGSTSEPGDRDDVTNGHSLSASDANEPAKVEGGKQEASESPVAEQSESIGKAKSPPLECQARIELEEMSILEDCKRANKLKRNPFCDFCHGTADRNRRTRLPEDLVSCSSCGSSGHPSCLRFSDNIKLSVQRYDWQCIECKTCSTCHTADNEHQLLFCDDCDRSYHTYCLTPPLKELPEGHWSCKLCLVEYYGDKK